MKLYAVKVQIVDDAGDLVASVETLDECAASVTIRQPMHNGQSWRELADAVGKALEMLELTA